MYNDSSPEAPAKSLGQEMLLNLKRGDLARPVYRIISLERLVDLFESKENVLVSPSKWEDTFENFILKSKVKLATGKTVDYNMHNSVFGQCWTLHDASDAMWRIYSPNKDGVRIKSTIGDLLSSIYKVHKPHPDARCCIGKVEYKTTTQLTWHANNTFDESGISVDKLFRSLLLKRLPFEHEKEVRLLYQSWNSELIPDGVYKYKVDPTQMVKEIMIDPRRSYQEFKILKLIIQRSTKYTGPIKRSLMYQLPKNLVVRATDDFGFSERR